MMAGTFTLPVMMVIKGKATSLDIAHMAGAPAGQFRPAFRIEFGRLQKNSVHATAHPVRPDRDHIRACAG